MLNRLDDRTEQLILSFRYQSSTELVTVGLFLAGDTLDM